MTASAGWYPDPSGVAQLRFWDGQGWTSNTAAAEPPAPAYSAAPAPAGPPAYLPQPTYVAQPVYQAQDAFSSQPSYGAQLPYAAGSQAWGATPPPGFQPQKPSRRKGVYALAAGVVAVALVATVIPLTTGGHSAPSTAKLTSKLLTNDAVERIAIGNFTSAPATDDNSDDDNSKTDCSNVEINPKPGAEKADAGREFTGNGQFAEEDLDYTVGAAALFTQLKNQMATCHTLTMDGGQLTLSTLAAPSVSGSDDTFGMQASGTISGVAFVFDIVAARFGNGVIGFTYGAADQPAAVAAISNQLLSASAAKVKSAF